MRIEYIFFSNMATGVQNLYSDKVIKMLIESLYGKEPCPIMLYCYQLYIDQDKKFSKKCYPNQLIEVASMPT